MGNEETVLTLPYRVAPGVGIRYLVRRLRSKNRQARIAEQANLFEYGSLIPIDMLVCELVATEMDNSNERHLNPPIGRSNAGQHPRHLLAMSEPKNHFIDDLIFSDGT